MCINCYVDWFIRISSTKVHGHTTRHKDFKRNCLFCNLPVFVPYCRAALQFPSAWLLSCWPHWDSRKVILSPLISTHWYVGSGTDWPLLPASPFPSSRVVLGDFIIALKVTHLLTSLLEYPLSYNRRGESWCRGLEIRDEIQWGRQGRDTWSII